MKWPWQWGNLVPEKVEEPKEMKCPACDGPTTPKTITYTDTGDVDTLFRCSPCEFLFGPNGKPFLLSKPRKRPNPFAEDVEI